MIILLRLGSMVITRANYGFTIWIAYVKKDRFMQRYKLLLAFENGKFWRTYLPMPEQQTDTTGELE